MITIKYSELERIRYSFQKLLQKEIPIKIAVSLSKIYRKIEEEHQIYSDQRNKIIDKYGRKDDKGKFIIEKDGSIKIKEGFEEECKNKINELNDVDFEIDFQQIEIKDLQLEKIEGFIIFNLEKFIK